MSKPASVSFPTPDQIFDLLALEAVLEKFALYGKDMGIRYERLGEGSQSILRPIFFPPGMPYEMRDAYEAAHKKSMGLRDTSVLTEKEQNQLEKMLQDLIKPLSELLQSLGISVDITKLLTNAEADFATIMEAVEQKIAASKQAQDQQQLALLEACKKQLLAVHSVIQQQQTLLAKAQQPTREWVKAATLERVLAVTAIASVALEFVTKVGVRVPLGLLVGSAAVVAGISAGVLYVAKFGKRLKAGHRRTPGIGSSGALTYAPESIPTHSTFYSATLSMRRNIRRIAQSKLGLMTVMRQEAAQARDNIAELKLQLVKPAMEEYKKFMLAQIEALKSGKIDKEVFLSAANKELQKLADAYAATLLGATPPVPFSSDLERNYLIRRLMEENPKAANSLSRAIYYVTAYEDAIEKLKSAKNPGEAAYWRAEMAARLAALVQTWKITKDVFSRQEVTEAAIDYTEHKSRTPLFAVLRNSAAATTPPVEAGKLPPKKDIQNKNDAYDDLQRGLKNLDGILRKEKSKKINFEAVADAIKADFPDSLTNRFFTIVNMATPESVREQEPDLKSDMIGALKYRASVKKTGDIEAADQILYKALTPRGQILADKLEFSPDEAKQMLEIYALINKLSKLAKLNAPNEFDKIVPMLEALEEIRTKLQELRGAARAMRRV